MVLKIINKKWNKIIEEKNKINYLTFIYGALKVNFSLARFWQIKNK
jgi:hypothetical protein